MSSTIFNLIIQLIAGAIGGLGLGQMLPGKDLSMRDFLKERERIMGKLIELADHAM